MIYEVRRLLGKAYPLGPVLESGEMLADYAATDVRLTLLNEPGSFIVTVRKVSARSAGEPSVLGAPE